MTFSVGTAIQVSDSEFLMEMYSVYFFLINKIASTDENFLKDRL